MPPANHLDTGNRSPDTLTVSQLNHLAKRLLESHFDYLWVEGELSNLATPASGHWYFTLKDDRAQVRCAMFRNRNQRLRTRPENGQLIRLRARVSLYEGRGEFQLVGTPPLAACRHRGIVCCCYRRRHHLLHPDQYGRRHR